MGAVHRPVRHHEFEEYVCGAYEFHPGELIWQDEPRVEVRSRRDDGWLVKTFGPGDTVELQAGVAFTVDELYAK